MRPGRPPAAPPDRSGGTVVSVDTGSTYQETIAALRFDMVGGFDEQGQAVADEINAWGGAAARQARNATDVAVHGAISATHH